MVHNLVHNLCESLVTNIGDIVDTGKRTPPVPITYLTQWRMMGNSEVHGTEIWSCGEYNPIDGKWHIRILPEGYGVVDIALDEPLRKVNNVADTIEFANGSAVLTRNLGVYNISDLTITVGTDISSDVEAGLFVIDVPNRKYYSESSVLTAIYTQVAPVNSIYVAEANLNDKECCYYYREPAYYPQRLFVYDTDYIGTDAATIKQGLQGQILIYELATPTTETIQVPQIEEADSYSCEMSQGAKAVSWSSFETE